jgi:hypothetical protein
MWRRSLVAGMKLMLVSLDIEAPSNDGKPLVIHIFSDDGDAASEDICGLASLPMSAAGVFYAG